MKKLLSLLNVLTISGTTMPTIIAASPYQKENNNNLREIMELNSNNEKENNNLKRNKRENITITLNVPSVKQDEEFRCGPAIGEAILRYFNFTRPNPLWEYQNILSFEMNTNEAMITYDTILGTIPECWQCTMNSIIQQFNLNENRNYSLYELTNNYVNNTEFFNIILNSLRNNTPIALAYSGNMPGQSEETLDQHFVLIYGMNGNSDSPQNTNYYYMDPATGRSAVFTGNDLFDITKGKIFPNQTPMKSYILFYNPQNNLHKNIFTNLNNNEYCDINSPINISKITVVNFLNKNNKGKDLKIGDVYIGTTSGLYLKNHKGIFNKVDNIDNEITSIKHFENGNFYVSTNDKKVYFLNTKFINDGHIIGERLWNTESSNLKKEIKFFYDENKNEKTIGNDWGKNTYSNLIYKNFNLSKISPFNYKKIEFLGSKKNFELSRMSWGNNPFYASKFLNHFNGVIINDYIINYKTLNNYDVKLDNCKFNVQNWRRTNSPVSNVEWYIYVGLTAYEEYHNWNLQLLSIQFAKRHGGGDNGGIVTGIGNGIRLYNDDYDYFRTSENNNL
jgi:hypothetical protein